MAAVTLTEACRKVVAAALRLSADVLEKEVSNGALEKMLEDVFGAEFGDKEEALDALDAVQSALKRARTRLT